MGSLSRSRISRSSHTTYLEGFSDWVDVSRAQSAQVNFSSTVQTHIALSQRVELERRRSGANKWSISSERSGALAASSLLIEPNLVAHDSDAAGAHNRVTSHMIESADHARAESVTVSSTTATATSTSVALGIHVAAVAGAAGARTEGEGDDGEGADESRSSSRGHSGRDFQLV